MLQQQNIDLRAESQEQPAENSETLTRFEAEWFADLWRANSRRLIAYAYKRLKDVEEARETIADLATHLLTPHIYRMMGPYPTNEQFRRFAFHNLKFTLGRRSRNRNSKTFGRQIRGPEEEPAYQDPIMRFACRPASRRSPCHQDDSVVVESVIRNERREAVLACLANLRDRDREVIYFTEGLGGTSREAIERFGVSKSTIEVIKRRSLAILREHAPKWLKPEDSFEKSVLKLYREGVPSKAIAKRIGCSYTPVARFLRGQGLPTDRGFVGGREVLR